MKELIKELYRLADDLEVKALMVRKIGQNWEEDLKPTFDEVNDGDLTEEESIHEPTQSSVVQSEE